MRHAKTVNVHLNAKAIAQARAAGPGCAKCRHLTALAPRAGSPMVCGLGCPELDPNACGRFKDCTVPSPLLLGGTLGSWVGRA